MEEAHSTEVSRQDCKKPRYVVLENGNSSPMPVYPPKAVPTSAILDFDTRFQSQMTFVDEII